MGRPPGYQWQPLGLDTDPVPGDPGRISQEAAHLAAVAKEISGQVAALHQMAAGGADGALKGQYADEIHSSARELADQLDKVVGRYEKVSSALNGWIPDLEQAQSMSLQALNEAEGPAKKLNQTVVLPSGSNLTAAQKQSVQDYHNAMKQAQGQLDAAKALLGKATTLRDNSASYHAGLINRAIDDGVKDSWWDQFKEWIDHYAWLIKDICTVLEIAAAVLAVLALIFTGVGWIVLLGVALTAVALLGRTLVAAAGDGSWWDVGMDAVALFTFGLGEVGTKALSTLSDNAVTIAKGFESAKAADLMSSFEKLMGPKTAQVVMAKFLEKTVPEIGEAAKTTILERIANAGDAGSRQPHEDARGPGRQVRGQPGHLRDRPAGRPDHQLAARQLRRDQPLHLRQPGRRRDRDRRAQRPDSGQPARPWLRRPVHQGGRGPHDPGGRPVGRHRQ